MSEDIIETASGYRAAEGPTIHGVTNTIGGHEGYRISHQIVCNKGNITGGGFEIDHQTWGDMPVMPTKQACYGWAWRKKGLRAKDFVKYHPQA